MLSAIAAFHSPLPASADARANSSFTTAPVSDDERGASGSPTVRVSRLSAVPFGSFDA